MPAAIVVLKTVPNVLGETHNEASNLISSSGFALGTITSEASSTIPAGAVLRQSPSGDSQAAAGSVVSIVVSSGPALVSVPSLVGQSQASAEAQIGSAGLTLGTLTIYSSATVPAGNVISQTPAPAHRSRPAAVSISSCRPARSWSADPSVVGQTQADAQSNISLAGLTVGTVGNISSQTVPAGSVVSQVPAGATQAIAGSAVNIVVSTGTGTLAVPSVVGQTQANAQATLTAAGFTLGTVVAQSSTTVPAGTVVSQSPAAQSQATPGSAVNLAVSAGPPVETALAVTRTVFSDGTGNRTTSTFAAASGELLVAFVSSDGPSGRAQTATVSGSGLVWTLVRRVNMQAGVSEIWSALVNGAVANATVTSTPSIAGYHQSLTLVGFSGASGVGVSVGASGSTGAPTASLTTSKAGSLVYAVGNDWDRAVTRVLANGQTMAHQWIDTSVGDTFWVQATTVSVATNTVVQMRATSPTSDRWNMAAVEILAR